MLQSGGTAALGLCTLQRRFEEEDTNNYVRLDWFWRYCRFCRDNGEASVIVAVTVVVVGVGMVVRTAGGADLC